MSKITNLLLLAIAAFLFLTWTELHSINNHLYRIAVSASAIDDDLDTLKAIENDLSR